MIKIFLIIILLLSVGCTIFGSVTSNVERPDYKILSSEGDIEIRQYQDMIVAEAVVKGEREEAINKGFRLLADYIFGNNIVSNKISMTAPVTQQKNQKIAMTAPVLQTVNGEEWKINFIMPSEYSFDNLPKPNNEKVKLKKILPKKVAAIKFSGRSTKKNIIKHENELQEFLESKKLKILSVPSYAFYNPPWTMPFLRRNEVMVEVE